MTKIECGSLDILNGAGGILYTNNSKIENKNKDHVVGEKKAQGKRTKKNKHTMNSFYYHFFSLNIRKRWIKFKNPW